MSRKATALALVACLFTIVPVARVASAVFDMSTERPAQTTTSPPAVQDSPAAPASQEPSDAGRDTTGAPSSAAGVIRPILPWDVLRLAGELDSRSWTVELTRAQAESGATLTVAYKAAIVVAPESSKLRVLVNDRIAIESPIAASEDVGQLSVQLPAGLLHSGSNLIRVEASQRHRTDCSIASTYDLWTEIYGSGSALHFIGGETLRRIEDIGASGVDQTGVAHLRIIAPALGRAALTRSIIGFAEGAALLIGEPNQTVAVSKDASGPTTEGVLTAAIGTAGDLQAIALSVPSDAANKPIAAFVDDAKLGSVLILSGPTDAAVSQAVDSVISFGAEASPQRETSIPTNRWFAPDAPLLTGAARVSFANLGVHTQEFSGRRFTTQFLVGVPSDFYASNYGQATILLDAAYSGEVLPGSHLDVYVNDYITATTPITSYGGAILRHLPIRLLMTHFKPGANIVRFEAQLLTDADRLCPLGGGASLSSRFVLFDSSEFVMPDYARLGRLPDLAGFTGTGFPYDGSNGTTALVVDSADPDAVSAAATLLTKLAVASGRVVPIEIASPATIGQRNAIFVMTTAQTPDDVLNRVGVDLSARATWTGPTELNPQAPRSVGEALEQAPAAEATFAKSDELDTRATFNRWRRQLADGGGWRGNVSFLQDWLQRTFQLSAVNLRFLPIADVAFQPARNSVALLAQATNPTGDGAWTLLTAPTSSWLREGARALTTQRQWSRIAGHIVSYDGKTGAMRTQAVTTFSVVPTQPLSIANLRLIAANWLSENIFAYSLLLLSACILLGLATARLVSRIGRQSP
jgi:cellulose synthase operon protein B